MSLLKSLFEQNREWSRRVQDGDPDFFQRLSDRQSPECLWIGCSDSRVPATQIVDGVPGDLFVHRNIANVVSQTDLNVQSVLQYAVDALEVKHVIVCDHYGCGGVLAVLQNKRSGPLRDWLEHVQGVQQDHRTFLETVPDDDDRWDRLCELNVLGQVGNLCQTSVVQNAWGRGQDLAVHGLIYRLQDGLLRHLGASITRPAEAGQVLAVAVDRITG